MEGIDVILQAEKEAERIRREAKIQADAVLGSAEGYRQHTLEAARREGEAEADRLLGEAEKRAEGRKAELKALAAGKNEALRSEALKRLETAAKAIAERIAGI